VTKVVNLRRERYDVYIGRAGRGQDGYFGNPYPVGQVCSRCGKSHHDAGSTLPCFRKYFKERLNDPIFHSRVLQLKGKVLGCFCKKVGIEPCHGDVYVAWLEERE
jgi:hypothetical protein